MNVCSGLKKGFVPSNKRVIPEDVCYPNPLPSGLKGSDIYFWNMPFGTIGLECNTAAAGSSDLFIGCTSLLTTLAPHSTSDYSLGDANIEVSGLTDVENYDAYKLSQWGDVAAGATMNCGNRYWGCMKTIVCQMTVSVSKTCGTESKEMINLAKGYQGATPYPRVVTSKSQSCRICAHTACPKTTKNGFWAPPLGTYSSILPNYFPISTDPENKPNNAGSMSPIYPSVISKPCAPGTWLTCNNADKTTGCTYYSAYQGQSDVDWIKSVATSIGPTGPPILVSRQLGTLSSGCYKCPLASGESHYTGPDRVKYTTSYTYKAIGFLDFYCPGENHAPKMCDPNMGSYVGPNDDTSGVCQCIPGTYLGPTDKCVSCPPGYKCVVDTTQPGNPTRKIPCPDGQFQKQAGGTSCSNCTTKTQCTTGWALLKCDAPPNGAADDVRYKTEDASCVRCSGCSDFITDGYPCLGVTKIQALIGTT
jgi:hypothetical protein